MTTSTYHICLDNKFGSTHVCIPYPDYANGLLQNLGISVWTASGISPNFSPDLSGWPQSSSPIFWSPKWLNG